MLHGLFQARRIVAAREFYMKMVDSGTQLGISTYNIVLRGLCENSCVDEALRIFEGLRSKEFQLEVWTFNIMINALLKVGRIDEAKGLFSAIVLSGPVPDVITYSLMIESHIKEGLFEESDELFLSMEKNGCAANSRMLNVIVRRLLEKGYVRRAGTYLTKIDEKNFSLEASTAALLISIVSETKYQKEVKFIPEKYQCFTEPRDD
jgi:pentatricopeptide repeat protein